MSIYAASCEAKFGMSKSEEKKILKRKTTSSNENRATAEKEYQRKLGTHRVYSKSLVYRTFVFAATL